MPEFIRFEHASFWAEAFDTPHGPIEMDAQVTIEGTTLFLNDFAIEPLDQPVLPLKTEGLRALRRQLLLFARQQGYTESSSQVSV